MRVRIFHAVHKSNALSNVGRPKRRALVKGGPASVLRSPNAVVFRVKERFARLRPSARYNLHLLGQISSAVLPNPRERAQVRANRMPNTAKGANVAIDEAARQTRKAPDPMCASRHCERS